MGLRDLQILTTTITTPGGDFAVRGLAFADIVVIANSHGPQASMLFAKIVNKEALDKQDVHAIISGIIPQAPDLIAAVIALAADEYEPEMIEKAKKLGFQSQIAALEAIFYNTFRSEAELKNFMESIIRMLSGATDLVQQMRLPLSEAGFGESVKK